mmetsp:Transcript_52534/g.157481  ORF Transcript_52534/g.157481 Transcript_52534/m.157481 type:complete len:222 (+) Transcript_52534:145-810(+)
MGQCHPENFLEFAHKHVGHILQHRHANRFPRYCASITTFAADFLRQARDASPLDPARDHDVLVEVIQIRVNVQCESMGGNPPIRAHPHSRDFALPHPHSSVDVIAHPVYGVMRQGADEDLLHGAKVPVQIPLVGGMMNRPCSSVKVEQGISYELSGAMIRHFSTSLDAVNGSAVGGANRTNSNGGNAVLEKVRRQIHLLLRGPSPVTRTGRRRQRGRQVQL